MQHRDMSTMTDRELAEETLMWLRTVADTLESMSSNPMVRMMMPNLPASIGV